MALGDVIARLSVSLNLDSAAFESGSKKAGAQAHNLGDRMEKLGHRVGTAIKGIAAAGVAMGAAFIVNQVKEMATSGLAFASSLGEQAQQLGVTTGELQRYRYIATQVGIEQDVMDKGLARLSITLGDLKNGLPAPTKAMQALGLSAAEIAQVANMGPGQAIPILADKFKALSSDTERAAVAADLFGSRMGGKFLTLLSGGSEEINKLADAYKKLGIELSEGEIAKADEVADKMAALQQVMAAKQAKVAVEGADALLKGTEAWDTFKIKALDALGKTSAALSEFDAKGERFSQWIAETDRRLGIPSPSDFTQSIATNFSESWKRVSDFFTGLRNFAAAAPGWISSMASQIGSAITGKLGAVWDAAKAKVEQVRQTFFNLWDKVTRRSYVPDMVDDIAREMARLDGVMVDKAVSATGKTKAAFQKLRDDLGPLMAELFPEGAAKNANTYKASVLDQGRASGAISSATWAEGMERLNSGFQSDNASNDNTTVDGITSDAAVNMTALNEQFDRLSAILPVFTPQIGGLSDTFDRLGIDGGRLKDSLASAFTDVILGAQSFGDALKNVFNSFASKILDKLGSDLLGNLLGGIIPGFATGTPSAPRGLALVGERGPELVNFRGGERVIPHNSSRGAGNAGVTRVEIVDTTGLFVTRVNGQIMQASPGIAAGASDLAQRQSSYKRSRSLAA